MEKVQVISVKPICSSNEENLYTCQLESKSVISESDKADNAKISHQKNSSFAFRDSVTGRTANLNGDNQAFRKDHCNASFKNAISRSHKEKIPKSIDEKFSSNKGGFSFPASSNCFGRSDFRASYNERLRPGPTSLQQFTGYKKEKKLDSEAGGDFVYLTGNAVSGSGLYKSNSSLELDHEPTTEISTGTNHLKREYGSHGSINVAAVQQESLYSVLQSYQQDPKQEEAEQLTDTSPKVLSKIHRLWDKDKPSIFKKFLPSKSGDTNFKSEKVGDTNSEINSNLGGTVISNSNAKSSELMESDNKEEMASTKLSRRRSAIAHYDCQSLASQLSPERLKSLLADRSNTTTGASAAAMAESSGLQNSAVNSSSEELASDDHDYNDERSNHLVCSCPFFENEIGGEGERIVSLSREVIRPNISGNHIKASNLHRSASASSIGLLEPLLGTSFWCQTLCPYVKKSPILEKVDQGSSFYLNYFRSQEHQNWFGVDELLGPVAISIKKEKVEENCLDKNHSLPLYQYRFIFRTSELYTCQGTIREEILHQRGEKGKCHGIRETIEYICPQLNVNCLRLGLSSQETEEELIKLDELGVHANFKVGVLYCRAEQKTEEEMYNNENSGPAFSEFLEILGQRVRLKNFDKYRGGLDKKTDSTGHYSVYTQFQGYEIMFHVSTLLPFTSNNKKQLLRKRHIGNDIVTIIFQEPGALPFTPKNIRSHFQHVFIIVQAINPCTDSTQYSIAVSRFQDVPTFGPPIPENATFPKSKKFVDFLLAKVINGELAVLRSEKFTCMAARTKHEYLKDLATKRITSTTLDTSSKFSLMGFSRASKKEKSRFKFVADSSVKGALSWNMVLYDATLQENIDCVLAISVDSVVVLETSSSSVVFAASCRSILGWTSKPKQGKVFYILGYIFSIIKESVLLFNLCQGLSDSDSEEVLNDIVTRLSAVTQGAEGQELVLRRNPSGLLGFNVQQDGIITEVEPFGPAAQARLQQGSRLVEICKVALATLSQEQMVDLLKTSRTVTVTVIPPHPDGSPRRGCNVPTCSFLLGCSEGDYENLTPPEQGSVSHMKTRLKQLNRLIHNVQYPPSQLWRGSSAQPGTYSGPRGPLWMRSTCVPQRKHGPPRGKDGSGEHGGGREPKDISLGCVLIQKMDKYVFGIGESGTLKFSDYTGTLSSTSSGHSTDRWSESAAEAPTKLNLTSQQYNSNQNYQRQQSPFSHSEREYSPPPPPLPARLYQTCKSEQGYYDNDNARFVARPDGGVSSSSASKKANLRRNSSPLALETKDLVQYYQDPDELKRSRDAYVRTARHSIPKSVEDSSQDSLQTCRSEDELSGSSGSSPHGFQKVRSSGCGGSTSSSISSRTQSPHNSNQMPPPNQTVRLKPSVQNSKTAHQRNSATLGSSNLQEELLKLINPDYLSDSESMGAEIREQKESNNINKINSFPTYEVEESIGRNGKSSRPALQNTRTTYSNENETSSTNAGIYDCLTVPYQSIGEAEFTNRKKVFSRTGEESGSSLDHINMSSKKPQTSEGLLLTARPATVISNASTASSPACVEGREKQTYRETTSSDFHKNKEGQTTFNQCNQNISNKNKFEHAKSLPSNDGFVNCASSQVATSLIDKEWNSLVNTATLAIEKTRKSPSELQDVNANSSTHPQQTQHGSASSALSEEVINSIPEEIRKYIPIYCKFLKDSESETAPRSQSYNEKLLIVGETEEDPNGNSNNDASVISTTPLPSTATLSLPPTADDETRQLVQKLERELVCEQEKSGKLMEEVNLLRQENAKLLKDNRSAAKQMHQFTEWFFHNIHKS
ncbi:Signal-induced proliferation-associated 1-like protein 1 [Armadillidium vulgare]|nr:Signal-induced proliferation-associated 1-like protein 1 [Armadillidium vulgare]